MPLFTPNDREALRAQLIDDARDDSRISAAAHLGSFALDRHDRWSDIDLALGLAAGVQAADVIDEWTARLYGQHGAVAHHDVRYGTALYRVFLLENTLQIDLSFWPHGDFGSLGPAFRLVFGDAVDRAHPAGSSSNDLIGFAWLYALHVRSSLARGRRWQSEYMLSAVRDHALALACMRLGLPPREGRGMDDLPAELLERWMTALPASLDDCELRRAFGVTTRLLIAEIERVDRDLARRIEPTLLMLAAGG